MTKPKFESNVVREKVASLLPVVSAFAPVSGGEESQAFRFTSGSRRLIVRLSSAREGYDKDKFVFEHFAKPELPIPEIFQIGSFQDHFFCISEEMAGTTLEDLDGGEISQLLLPTCDVWRAIATSDVAGLRGYGPFDGHGETTYLTWRSFLVDISDPSQHQWQNARPYVDGQTLTEWIDALSRLTAFCPEERALVHGDFGSNNILAEREHITGVLDWSEAMIGDPLYDIANIFYWRTWLSCMEQQASYFESHPPDVPNWQRRLLCYQLRIGLSELIANVQLQNPERIVWSMERCRQIVSAVT